MAINYKPIDEIPETAGRRGPRDSECMRAFMAAKNSPTRQVEVEADDRQEIERFYQSMIQWRNRHRESGVQVKKDGPNIYVWVPKEDGDEDSRG
ncbi:MAG: hypothetical protein U5Q44_09350 [Dehalococcoidia bacterium]|nr:hypothetical protein [Dehalococcoidia bacterium]